MKNLFLLTVIFCFFFNTFTYAIHDQQKEYISKSFFSSLSDFSFSDNPTFEPKDVFEGAMIFVPKKFLRHFFKTYHQKIKKKYSLLTLSDAGMPGKFKAFLEDDKILAWFGMNPTLKHHHKFHPLPIGIKPAKLRSMEDFENGNLEDHKEYLLYLNFSINAKCASNSKKSVRQHVYDLFNNKEYCYCSPEKPFEEYIEDIKNSYFVLSPRGNGIDCYRTWEAIAMGAIPIVESTGLDPLFEGLPVLITNDWSEINEEFLRSKYNEMIQKEYSYEKLYTPYWREKIHQLRQKANEM